MGVSVGLVGFNFYRESVVGPVGHQRYCRD